MVVSYCTTQRKAGSREAARDFVPNIKSAYSNKDLCPSRNRYRLPKMVYNHHQCWRRSLFSLFKNCEWLQGSESTLIEAAQGQLKGQGRDEAQTEKAKAGSRASNCHPDTLSFVWGFGKMETGNSPRVPEWYHSGRSLEGKSRNRVLIRIGSCILRE